MVGVRIQLQHQLAATSAVYIGLDDAHHYVILLNQLIDKRAAGLAIGE